MLTQQTGVLLLLLSLVALLISNKVRPAILFLTAIGSSFLLDWISLDTMVGNFVNSSLLTLVLLLLVSVAVEKTALVNWVGQQINQGSFVTVVAKLGLSTALLSSITNNTAVVASLIGAVKRNQRHSPSKLLLPLSYAAILGGTLTLIGTSTNLIVNSFVVDAGLEPIGFFDFTLIGAALVVGGLIVIMLLGHRLPDRLSQQTTELPYMLEAVVSDKSVMAGKTVQANSLRSLQRLYLAEIERDGEMICPVPPTEILQAGDRLMFAGDMESLHLLQQMEGLEWFGRSHLKGQSLVEVIVSHSASINGKTIKESRFRRRFDAAVVAIRRGHSRLSGGFGQHELRAGDTLILVPGKSFNQNPEISREFVMVSDTNISARLDKHQSRAVLGGFLAVLGLALTGTVALIKGLLLLLVVFLLTRVISVEELRRRFPLELVAIVGSALGLAQIMVSSGVAESMGDQLLLMFNGWGMLGAFVAVYFFTLILTEVITNNAAAALAFPIAYSLALGYGVDPRPFIMAVIFGASASFLSPYGYQTNLMVYSAGNYRWVDYLGIGLPVSLVYSAIVIYLVPLVFPFVSIG